MTEYELINPSDPYTFLAKTKESAALAVFLLGTMYGASPKDDDEEKRIPVFLFGGAEEWYQEEFGRSTEEGPVSYTHLERICMIMVLDYSGRCLHINSGKKEAVW